MLKLYGAARSRAVRNIWMLDELGLDYQLMDWLPRAPETNTPEFRAIAPSGAIPVLDDDGFILSESMAINFYLAQKYASTLYPSDPQHQALALQWSFWETDRLDRQLVNHARHGGELPEAERNSEIARVAWEEIVQAMPVLDAALENSEWLAGPAFSVADVNVASAMFRALALDLADWPNVDGWLRRCWDRPSAQKAKAMRG